MATKKGPKVPPLTVEQIRAVLADEAGGVERIAEATGKSVSTIKQYTKGLRPKGAPEFPGVVTTIGRSDVRCVTECVEWVRTYAPRRVS